MKKRFLQLTMAVLLLGAITACGVELPFDLPFMPTRGPVQENPDDNITAESEQGTPTNTPSALLPPRDLGANPETGAQSGNTQGGFLPPRIQPGDSGTGTTSGNTSGGFLPPRIVPDDSNREISFPDPNFEAVVREVIGRPFGAIMQSDVARITEISVWNRGITDLTGIEYFTALEWLECSDNYLTTLDLSRNTALDTLYSDNNQLTSLDVSLNTELELISVRGNRLTSLDVRNNAKLYTIYCQDNRITSLDVRGNPLLEWLDCRRNDISTLEIGGNTRLRALGCADNRISSLDLRDSPALQMLESYNNNLTALDVSNNTALRWLDVSGNNFRDRASVTGVDFWNTIVTFDTVTSQPGAVSFNGIPITPLFGRRADDVISVMGAPLGTSGDQPIRGGLMHIDYDGIYFWFEHGYFVRFEVSDMRTLQIDGITANVDRDGILRAFGLPSNHGWHDWYDWYTEFPEYIMMYHFPNSSVQIHFDDPTHQPIRADIRIPR